MPRKKKVKVKLNDVDSLTHLMQETYNDACNQQSDAQNAINIMVNSAQPEDVDDITKIAKEKANLLKVKDSAIRVKLELSKLKSEFLKRSTAGDTSNGAVSEAPTLEDFKAVRDLLKQDKGSTPKTYEID